jgi:hypothetical protein
VARGAPAAGVDPADRIGPTPGKEAAAVIKSVSTSLLHAFTLGLTLLVALEASALTLTSSGNERGTFNSSLFKDLPFFGPGTWKAPEGTYFVRGLGDDGAFSGGTPTSYEVQRSYHIFDLSSLGPGQVITGATLFITHPSNSYSSPDPTETVRFFDVSTPLDDLRLPDESQPNSALDAIFDDLGSGSVYGEFVASAASNGTIESITLNAAALADLNAAIGGEWALGAALVTIAQTSPLGVEEQVFKGSETLPGVATTLNLTVIPEPGTSLLVGIGLMALARRRAGR